MATQPVSGAQCTINGCGRDTEEARRCVALLLQQCGATGAVPVDMMSNLRLQHWKAFNLCDAGEGDLTIICCW